MLEGLYDYKVKQQYSSCAKGYLAHQRTQQFISENKQRSMVDGYWVKHQYLDCAQDGYNIKKT